MNKKILLCVAIATGLLVTACVKKEAPKEDQQTEATSEPMELQPLTPPSEVIVEETVIEPIEPTSSSNTPTTTQAPETATVENSPAVNTPNKVEKTESQPQQNNTAREMPSTSVSSSQSQDEAVAAAIAAATPALNN